MIDLHLSQIKHTKCQECLYTGIGGSDRANTDRGLSSRGKVEETVNECINNYLNKYNVCTFIG